ncbi:MBL fold metallo-hydrolase [Streptomonospora salina]|uniref:Glyoxylase-like metal-dependent hydrolase (Beta-lactamase superfamily II) n=1 Tax=Streptomonospora salina TaxID=104205 RepID=A0A841EIC5_9ACTN|nr:MBL fold metallo-hydrolase [Streptomonospora salina]MBB6000568.1 glyoxylase-like metal-dependent hydrolase (beta-lactamase superfamily II) [Streptomonospora salina]
MFISAFPAGPLAANCYLVAAADRAAECVIVDPGQDAGEQISARLAEHGLVPAAVLLTHGHFDHVWSAAEVARDHGVAVYVHGADRPLLSDPAKGLGPGLAAQLSALLGQAELEEPTDVRELAGGETLELAGLELSVEHVPGHTPGSVCYGLAGGAAGDPVLFTGDLLFAGAIGRTDFPGGDHGEILRSLERVCRDWPDGTDVRPGHGTPTTIGGERAANPFLADIPGR